MDYKTYVIDLPIGCKGFVCEDTDLYEPIIFLNAKYNRDTNRKTYIHELQHINRQDLQGYVVVNNVEDMCHKNHR